MEMPAAQPPARPGRLIAAAVILIVAGVLVGLIGALIALSGALFGTLSRTPEFQAELGRVPDAFGPFLAVVGGLVLLYGIVAAVSGIRILSGRSWARITGLVVAILGLMLTLAGVVPGANGFAGVSTIVSLAFLVAFAYVTYVLMTDGRWFTVR